jgi:hypothetical protein
VPSNLCIFPLPFTAKRAAHYAEDEKNVKPAAPLPSYDMVGGPRFRGNYEASAIIKCFAGSAALEEKQTRDFP